MNVLLFLGVACFWGGSFIAIQPLVHAMPPLMAGALRIGIGVAFLSLILPSLKIPFSVAKGLRLRVWVTGLVAFAIPFAFLFWGEQSISPGLAGILNGTVPIFVFLLGLAFTPGVEKVTLRKISGLLFGIVGVIAIFLPKVLESGADPSLAGTVAVTLMAVCYATSVLLNRVIFSNYPKLHPFTNLYQQLWAGFLGLLAISLLGEGWPRPENWRPLSTVVTAELYLGIGSTSIAFMMFYRLIKVWGPVRAATVTYVVPTMALVFDWVLNGSVPSPSEWLGVVCVTLGVVILNLNLPLRSRRASKALKSPAAL